MTQRAITNREEFEAALAHYARLEGDLARHDAQLKKTIAAATDKASKAAAPLAAELTDLAEAIEKWAVANRATEAKGNSIKVTTGKVSWRMGRAKLDLPPDAAGKEAAIKRIELAQEPRFLKTSVSINQRALLDEPEWAERFQIPIRPAMETFSIQPASLDVEE